jgi:hypothetical protein
VPSESGATKQAGPVLRKDFRRLPDLPLGNQVSFSTSDNREALKTNRPLAHHLLGLSQTKGHALPPEAGFVLQQLPGNNVQGPIPGDPLNGKVLILGCKWLLRTLQKSMNPTNSVKNYGKITRPRLPARPPP